MNDETLVFAQIIFRHGMRAADHTYPGDPYENYGYEPFGIGQLTQFGRKQSYEFGKELRAKYANLLGNEYHEGIVEAHSSEVPRARITLQLVLAGLFPPTTTTKVDDDLNWQPIIYHYKPLKEDPLFGYMITEIRSSESHSEFRKSENSLSIVNCMEANIGWKVTHNAECIFLYDVLKSQNELGLELPSWTSDIFPEKLNIDRWQYINENFQRQGYIKRGCGHFMKTIATNMLDYKSKKLPKIILYSGHDINLIAFMKLLKMEEIWPNYMASLTFELHLIDNTYFVKVIFIDGYLDPKQKEDQSPIVKYLTINSENLIKIEDFYEYINEYIS